MLLPWLLTLPRHQQIWYWSSLPRIFRSQRLKSSDIQGPARTCVYPKGIKVLHIADSDAVISRVTYHLVLDLLPSQQRLLHQHLNREFKHWGPDKMNDILITTFSTSFLQWKLLRVFFFTASLKFIPEGPTDNESSVVKVMAWWWTGSKSLIISPNDG